MSLAAAVGIGQALDGREAAQLASRRALDQIGNLSPVLALVFVSQEFSAQNAVAGVSAILGISDIWGFRTSLPFTREGYPSRSVVVAVLAGEDLKAQVNLYPGFAQDSVGTAQAVAQLLKEEITNPFLGLIAADVRDGDITQLLTALAGLSIPPVYLAGCLVLNEPDMDQPNVIGGPQVGPGALSTAWLTGRIRLGMGSAHGWQPVGAHFEVTSSLGPHLKELDGTPAIQAYCRFLGHSSSEWTQPPLVDFIRLYPLGISNDEGEMEVYSPVGVKEDGSLVSNIHVAVGSVAYLMVGSPQSCLEAAAKAAHEAMSGLASAKPILGMILVDKAWQTLMTSHGNPELSVIRSIIGKDLPLVGGYTLGQIFRPDLKYPPGVLNQHLSIILFGSELE